MSDKGFDEKCGELADHFLSDASGETRRRRNDLAQTIQDAIEDWLDVETWADRA